MIKLEYIWVDGSEPTSQLRSKTKVVEKFGNTISDCPEWGFDGSSTNQATGDNSDCVLKPVRLYHNPLEENSARGAFSGILEHRYGLALKNSEDPNQWLIKVAERHTSGDTSRMAQRLLDDFRKNLIGPISLELP